MRLNLDLDRLISGWRGPAIAALAALLAGLPGLLAMPPLDRDESRFAQATAQMLETGDFVNIRLQDQPRNKKPVGIHWLQAAAVAAVSSAEARDISAYRIPSLLGAMLAAAASVWGAAAFMERRLAVLSGLVLATGFILSTEAFIAKTDAALCGFTTLAMAALARLYAAHRRGEARPRGVRLIFWLAMAGALLIKGPIAPLVVAMTALGLWLMDRELGWMRRLGWLWGLALIVLIVGPWAVAITVATDGAFWTGAIRGDLAPKLAGGQERHGGPPGYHLLWLPVLFFPATLLLPAAALVGWTRRVDPAVRFAVAWFAPAFLAFELAPTKLPHYTLPLYPALAWLAVLAAREPLVRAVRWGGAGLGVFTALALSVATVMLLRRFGDPGDVVWASLTIGLAAVGAVVAAVFLIGRETMAGLCVALATGVLAHASLSAGVAPNLKALWVSKRLDRAMRQHGLDPRLGLQPGPATLSGYSEPSAVFLLGTDVDLARPEDAAVAVGKGRPVVIERKMESRFRAALAAQGLRVEAVDRIEGFNYSRGKPANLTLYRKARP